MNMRTVVRGYSFFRGKRAGVLWRKAEINKKNIWNKVIQKLLGFSLLVLEAAGYTLGLFWVWSYQIEQTEDSKRLKILCVCFLNNRMCDNLKMKLVHCPVFCHRLLGQKWEFGFVTESASKLWGSRNPNDVLTNHLNYPHAHSCPTPQAPFEETTRLHSTKTTQISLETLKWDWGLRRGDLSWR